MQINKHGSFYIRNGWPTKIIDAVSKEPLIFSPNNELAAVDEAGVGRVMIKAMRYWAVVLGITTESKSSQGVVHNLSNLGKLIAENDVYCQNVGTLWLMHRCLACNKENATAWYWAFNEMASKTFSKESFTNDFYAYVQKQGDQYAKNAIEKEFDCFKNTYVSDKSFDLDKIIDEETIPFFAPLKLIKYAGDGKYELRRSLAKDIPQSVAYYCILLDNGEHLNNGSQISIDLLLEGSNQIGKYMNLSYSALIELLQQIENTGAISMINNFGNRYIQVQNNDPASVISAYYSGIRR